MLSVYACTAKKISNLGFLRSLRDHFTPQYTTFALIYTDFTPLAVYVRSLFSITAVQLCGTPGLRPATVIQAIHYRLINLNGAGNCQSSLLFISAEGNLQRYNLLFFSTFISPIRYSVITCWDATRYLNETTAFARRVTDASLQGIGILERLLLKDHPRADPPRSRRCTRTRVYPSARSRRAHAIPT